MRKPAPGHTGRGQATAIQDAESVQPNPLKVIKDIIIYIRGLGAQHMAADFDPAEFVNRIGQKLVMEFDHASAAGTPGLIGSARENPARKQLEKLMPAFA